MRRFGHLPTSISTSPEPYTPSRAPSPGLGHVFGQTLCYLCIFQQLNAYSLPRPIRQVRVRISITVRTPRTDPCRIRKARQEIVSFNRIFLVWEVLTSYKREVFLYKINFGSSKPLND